MIWKIAEEDCSVSYKALFKFLYPKVFRFAFNYIKQAERAEEIAGDVLFQLWEKRADAVYIKNIEVYSFVLARNKALNELRQRKPDLSLDDIDIDLHFHEQTPENLLISQELVARINAAVSKLPPRAKMVYQLVKEEGLSYKEAAQILDISAKTVDAHLVSAMSKIMELLSKDSDLKKYFHRD